MKKDSYTSSLKRQRIFRTVVCVHISVKQHGRPGRTACHSAFNGVGR